MEIKRLSSKHKNNKVVYYIRNYLRFLIPNSKYRSRLDHFLNSNNDSNYINDRVNYYNKLSFDSLLSPKAKPIKDLELKDGSKTYVFDFKEYTRYFNPELLVNFEYGDVIKTPYFPAFVKSRPIKDNKNAVLLKWDKIRHFMFIKNDPFEFKDKLDKLIFRGKVHAVQPHRIKFMEMYKNHPLCDIGKVNKNELPDEWMVDRMTIGEQLKYKFVLSLEGIDVASNLKWVMSSNSLAVMPRPKFETWFMEGRLIPNVHYVEIKSDYSDLEDRLNYYINYPKEAGKILKNAHAYVKQFQNKEREKIISLKVIQSYFDKTNQKE